MNPTCVGLSGIRDVEYGNARVGTSLRIANGEIRVVSKRGYVRYAVRRGTLNVGLPDKLNILARTR